MTLIQCQAVIQEFNEQTQIWVDEVLNLMDEAFAIEKEVINSLKKSMQYFTLNNFDDRILKEEKIFA